jgi:hypothetical protein
VSRCTVVLGESGTSTGRRRTSQGWPASRSLEFRAARLRHGYGALAPAFDCAPLQTKAGAGDEARTRDVHLGKVVLYQLSYTRSFERDNNVQPAVPRNLLIPLEILKSVESESGVHCII